MDPDTDVCQTEQPQISYSFDFAAEQNGAIQSPNLFRREGSAMGSHILLGREDSFIEWLDVASWRPGS